MMHRTIGPWSPGLIQKRSGIDFCLVRLTPRNVATYIKALNENSSVHGIMVYYPIFGDARDHEIKGLVDPGKDVEGLNRHQSPALQATEGLGQPRSAPRLVPCTAKAVESLLHWLGIYDQSLIKEEQLKGWEICIINRSDVVGLPLAQLLASQGANVYSVDVSGVQIYHPSPAGIAVRPTEWTLQDVVQKSGVIISAVPHRAFKVNTKWIRRGAICMNVASAKVSGPYIDRIILTLAELRHGDPSGGREICTSRGELDYRFLIGESSSVQRSPIVGCSFLCVGQ